MTEGSTQPEETAGGESAAVPWYRRWWTVAAVALTVVVVVAVVVTREPAGDGAQVAAGGDESASTEPATSPEQSTSSAQATAEETSDPDEPDDEPTGAATTPTSEPATDGTDEPSATETAEPEPGSVPVFGAGALVVGEDVRPGTYRSDGPAGDCYWERVAGTSGEFEEIVANGNLAPEIVTVDDADTGFSSQGCGDWYDVEDTFPAVPATAFGDGTYVVGEHIEPGTYEAEGVAGEQCYWERRSGFSGEFEDIIANGGTPDPTPVEIAPGDTGFTTTGCGRWTRVG